MPRGEGRPSKLTPSVKKKLLDAIRAGSQYEPACAYAGISYGTFREWMKRGMGTHPTRSKNKEFADFANEVMKAEADGEISAVVSIKAASKSDWRAAAWMLERRHSDRWANSQKIEVLVSQRLESELDLLFAAIANDPEIPAETRQRIFENAAAIQDGATIGTLTN